MRSPSTAALALAVSVGTLVDELVRSGVRHFCVCPGSRSTPLALTIARHPTARLWMHLDERSAAYFGLGLAKARREPVGLVGTSGTAAANFFPAVVEAFYARVPLVVLTADRPHELRDCGAPQAIDQVRLFGTHLRWFVDLPEPEATPELLRYLRMVACRAVATAGGQPAGPVQINCPYREPLGPAPAVEMAGGDQVRDEHPPVVVRAGLRAPTPDQIGALTSVLQGVQRGLIVCGPQDDPALPDVLVRLAEILGFPILADPLSGLRCGRHDRAQVLARYDAFLRDEGFAARVAPEVVLRIGASPTSKALALYLQRHGRCRQVLVDGDAGWQDPSHLATDVVHLDARLLGEALVSRLGRLRPAADAKRDAWLAAWRSADQIARHTIEARLGILDELFEGKVFAELADLMPDGSTLYAGNSMPVRDLDSFFPGCDRSVRLLANRGASGIDGVVSSALGASAAGADPLILAIGDISFYHDSNGLLAARQHGLNATIVLLNNDGGGIFSFLPQAAEAQHFETLFGTPHGLDFRSVAETYGVGFSRVTSWDAFRRAVRDGVEADGVSIVEVRTERSRNLMLHRQIWQDVSATLARERVIEAATCG